MNHYWICPQESVPNAIRNLRNRAHLHLPIAHASRNISHLENLAQSKFEQPYYVVLETRFPQTLLGMTEVKRFMARSHETNVILDLVTYSETLTKAQQQWFANVHDLRIRAIKFSIFHSTKGESIFSAVSSPNWVFCGVRGVPQGFSVKFIFEHVQIPVISEGIDYVLHPFVSKKLFNGLMDEVPRVQMFDWQGQPYSSTVTWLGRPSDPSELPVAFDSTADHQYEVTYTRHFTRSLRIIFTKKNERPGEEQLRRFARSLQI